MRSASNSCAAAPSRFLALSLPRLSTDRILRERLGRSWISDAPREAAKPGPARSPAAAIFREAAGSAHRSRGVLAPAVVPLAQGRAPLALFEKTGGAQRLVALCEAASRLGLAPGLGVAEARARFPALDLVEADGAADRHLLETVADWCDRYTPLVALDGTSRLLLDISGCAHLFGGEAAMMAELLARLRAQGLFARAAIAPEAGTAQTLADHAPPGTRLAPGEERAAIEPLPVAALRLQPEISAMLARLGCKRVGEVLALPRAGLARRFDRTLTNRLDEALGLLPVPIVPRRPVPLVIHERRLFEPISRTEDILGLLQVLSPPLAADLERRGQGARRLSLTLFRLDGAVERIEVGTSAPTRDPVRLVRLFRERLKALGDEREAGFGYDLVRLAAESCDALAERQGDLGNGAGGEAEPVEALLDRLAARLGEASVLGLDEHESHRPERAEALVAALRRRPGQTHEGTPPVAAPRPLRILTPPEPVEATAGVPEGAPEQFRWRRAHHRVVRVEGPERIAPEWWEEDAGETRDYFRVEDMEGRRFWLFREGHYGTSGLPAWFMHGLFA